MYNHRKMKYEQKIKDNFNFVFLCKIKQTLHLLNIAVGLWRLAMGNSYQCILKTFAIDKSTAVKISKDFYSALRLP